MVEWIFEVVVECVRYVGVFVIVLYVFDVMFVDIILECVEVFGCDFISMVFYGWCGLKWMLFGS